MGQLSGVVASKRIIVGGGGGNVAGALVAVTALNATLFTTPASPVDSEYVVKISGVVFFGASQPGAACGQSPGGLAATASIGSGGYVQVNHEIVCGPGAAVGIPLIAASVGSYSLSYSYAAYKAI